MTTPERCGAVDVHYPSSGGGRAALVVAASTRFAPPWEDRITWLDEVEEYQPGQFFRRELPAIRAVLAEADPLDLLIVDGYVDLDPEGRWGLGAHVHAEHDIPIIGVAKTLFRPATQAIALLRGQATRPLFITAVGISLADAARLVAEMDGPYRLPDALRRVDSLARGKMRTSHE